jgi:acetyl esterase/lipase
VSWACFAVGVVALVLSLTSLVPPRGPVGSGFSFVPSWIVGEAPLHFLALVAGTTIGCDLEGGLGSWPGRVGLALSSVACAGLGVQFVSGLRSRRCFESALAEEGQEVPRWRWSTQHSRRVAGAVPIRPRGVERLRNIAYAPDASHLHRLDLYRRVGVAGPVAAPVLLYFHGGAWVMGDKREQGIPMLGHLAERGFVCVTANYALSPKAKWPRHVLDCKLALAWVKRHVAEYGGDPSLVFLSGGSAGGHLAALVALTANDPVWQPGFEEEDTSVAACIPLYGVYDFVDPERIGNANLTPILEHRVFGQADAEAFAAASPISRVSESAPPFLVVHGRNDVLVPVLSARAFVAALRARSSQPVTYVELPLTQHAFDNFWSPRTVHFVHALEVFVDRVVASRSAQREVGR